MRVVAVPGRHVRHPVTRRVIDERGTRYDPHDVAIAQLLAHGDLALVDDAPVENEALAGASAEASPNDPPAAFDAGAHEQE